MVKIGSLSRIIPPFLQAETGQEWVVTLRFLVKRGDFKIKALADQLNLKPFREASRPVLSNAERLTFGPARGSTEEIIVTVHSHDDVATDTFDAFLVRAAVSYQKAFGNLTETTTSTIPAEVLADAAAIAAEGLPPGWRVITTQTDLKAKPKKRPKL